MKYLAALFIALIVTIGAAEAQRPMNLKGPEAKNYKPWKDKDKTQASTAVFVRTEKLQGPAAKNYKPWKDKADRPTTVRVKEAKPRLMGPAYKNRKPWE